jgi:hypothetical protein
MINTRQDLDAIAGTPEHDAFMSLLAGTLWRLEKDDTAQAWVAIEDNSTIERFNFTRADFPDAQPPALPEYVPVAPVLPFADRRATLLSEVDQIAKAKRDAVVAAYSPAEMASWPIKRAEAMAWQASGNDADAPNLVIEAQARQVPLADLVSKVLEKAAQLAQIEALIAGHTGYLQDQLRAVADGDEAGLAAIDIHAGWPV